MVGQNYKSSLARSPRRSSTRLVSVDVSEAESGSSGDERVQITTYPGRRRRNSVVSIVRQNSASRPSRSSKTVRTSSRSRKRKPIKSALKKSSNSSSSTLVNTSDDSDTSDIDTSDAGSSDIDSSDIETSEDEAPARSKKNKSKKTKDGSCKKSPAGPAAADDSLPHPTCRCKECVQGRKVLRAVIQFEAKTKAAEAATAEAAKAAVNQPKAKGKQKGKKAPAVSETDDETSDVDTVDTSGDEIKPAAKAKNKKQQQQKNQPKPPPKPATKPTPKPAAKVANKPSPSTTVADKAIFTMPDAPKGMKPNLIMTPLAKVLQIEHAMEGPFDPKPNAFYDRSRGIARVYHGRQYGNHEGSLYGDYPKVESTPRTPAGAPAGYYPYGPHPPPGTTPYAMARFYGTHGPMPHGPPPSGYPQAWGEAPAGGFPGFPPPTKPANYAFMPHPEAQQPFWHDHGGKKGPASPEKPASDKGSKQGNVAWDTSAPKDQGWGRAPSNASKGSNKGNAAWGTSPPKDAEAWGSPAKQTTPPNNGWKGKTPSQLADPAPEAPSPIPSPTPGEPDPPADPSKEPTGWGGPEKIASPVAFGGWGEPATEGFKRSK